MFPIAHTYIWAAPNNPVHIYADNFWTHHQLITESHSVVAEMGLWICPRCVWPHLPPFSCGVSTTHTPQPSVLWAHSPSPSRGAPAPISSAALLGSLVLIYSIGFRMI